MDKLQERAATVSLIATVKDEARSIRHLLDSISAQTRLPDEVLIADGGSRDETPRLLEAWGARQPFPVLVLRLAGANIAQGRNAAIRAARGDVIAVTDAGVRLTIDRSRVCWFEPGVAVCAALGLDPWATIASGSVLATFDRNDAEAAVVELRAQGHVAAVLGEVATGAGVHDTDGVAVPCPARDETARFLSS